MKQIHKKFSIDQVKLFFNAYLKNRMSREEVEKELGIGKSRFFELLRKYRSDPDEFSIEYYRYTPTKLDYQTECAIQNGLRFDKQFV